MTHQLWIVASEILYYHFMTHQLWTDTSAGVKFVVKFFVYLDFTFIFPGLLFANLTVKLYPNQIPFSFLHNYSLSLSL